MKVSSPYFIHYVHDMDRAISFYETVFEVSASLKTPGWSLLPFEGFELALHVLIPGVHSEEPLPRAGVAWLVESIEDASTEIERCGGRMVELREPDDIVPVRVASFFDSEGNGFELRQAV